MSDTEIEKEIQEKGLTAPRVTPADVEAAIVGEYYFTALQGARMAVMDSLTDGGAAPKHPLAESLGLLTFCVLTLENGFTVTGESACASPENFDAELGRKIARQNATNKIWPLLGYALRERLTNNRVHLWHTPSEIADKLSTLPACTGLMMLGDIGGHMVDVVTRVPGDVDAGGAA